VTEIVGQSGRLRDLEALYGLADAIGRSETLPETLDEALARLVAALELERAAVLLLDDAGVMRFRAARGLSDEYMRAVEGHSPWPPDAVDPDPVLYSNVAEASELASLRDVIQAEGIGAVAFVPLVHHHRLRGKLMLYRDAPHVWTERELDLARTVATHIAAASERHRAQDQLRESRRQLEVILRQVADGVTVQDVAGRLVYANEAAARMIGFDSAEELLAAPIEDVMGGFELLDEQRRPLPPDQLPGRRAIAGLESAERLVCYRIRATGEERWSVVRASPVHGADGDIAFAVNTFHDITERRRLYEESSRSLALLDTLFVSAPVAIGFWDRDLRYVKVNDALAELNGLPAEEHIGKTLREVVPDLADVLEPVYRRVVDTGVPCVQEESTEWLPQRLGHDRHWLSSYYPVYTETGEIQGLGAVIMEITERKRAEEELEKFFSLVETTTDFVGMASLDGRGLYLNPAGYALVGLEPGTVGQHTLSDFCTPETAERFDREILPRAREAGYYRGEWELRHFQTGEPIPLEGIVFTIRDPRHGGPLVYATVQRDIRERRRVERELEARAQAARALQFVGDGVFVVDAGGIVRLWNPAAAAITGRASEEVEGRSAADVVPGWAEIVSRVPITGAGERITHWQTLPVMVGGHELWLSISAVAFGEGTVFAVRDVTKERGLERLKSDFVSTVSHELRTPLAAIYGAALTLRRDGPPLGEDMRSDLLGVIADEADRLARIVNDILWTSRIESGGLRVTIVSVDPVELAAGVVQAARLHVPPGIELDLVASPDLPHISADPDKVRQVLANLVDNAIKYSPDGGRIEVALERYGSMLRFTVRDEGLGIPPTERDRVFEKFYRLDPDLTRGVGGTGLGLYICRELVRRMNGWIWVESSAGPGSTIVVELPVQAEVAAHLYY
jgi:PAS domain S-box-containing protein